MSETHDTAVTLDALATRVRELETRVAALESSAAQTPSRRAPKASSSALSDAGGRPDWVEDYVVVELEASDTWIEIHEHSARPQLQRLIREVVHVEAPTTERLVIDRVRRAWGLKRAGGRVQDAFDQAIRQLVARGHVVRIDDALAESADDVITVRVPGADDASKRGAEDVPKVELQLALQRLAASAGQAVAADDLMMAAARIFGWTRRGGAIQERLNTALEAAIAAGQLERGSDGLVREPAIEPA